MFLTRYVAPDSARPSVGLELADGTLRALGDRDLHDLLALSIDEVRATVDDPGPVVEGPVAWLPPVSGRTEVWASGVTYLSSREARIEESSVGDVYAMVYVADRPELFFKSVAWRAVTDGDNIGIRADSPLNVPEPEVAVVANALGEAIGYTVCNDVSSRTIEGENPLYLPQAKVYAGACSLHRRIRLAWTIDDPQDLAVACTVTRDGAVAFEGTTSTARMRRPMAELLGWAFRGDHYPHGLILSTGTGIVPEMDFTLEPGDVVAIEVEGLGTLRNPVLRGRDPFRVTVVSG